MKLMHRKTYYLFIILVVVGLLISGINPHDYFTWFLEVFPAIIAIIIIAFTDRSFPLSNLLLTLIALHCYILFIGGHYTYAQVPLFDLIKDAFHHSRNNYDKIGHFIQGFVPAIIARELLIRKQVVRQMSWLSFICISICLAISSFYELIEAFVAIMTGESAEAFLGTQGYVWDTQTDMLLALVGSIAALTFLPRLHNASIEKLKS
ncbi:MULTISPECIES: DUF2238 domain-containing protein [Flavobacterium]|uniref:DUF2238 domain-containing protein n=1 Tax=Flavobacterium TaxID=237 RepID=UPI001FCB3CFF|nr:MULTISPECIES: DUF2238 domain-containing protein [Flavobacterium]UOK41705.1 DUF2238 domain-containing protein [Flavobacterium enshiense]